MISHNLVKHNLLPTRVFFPMDTELIDQVQTELVMGAFTDGEACRGYFSDFPIGENENLSACKYLAEQYPVYRDSAHEYVFSFTRVSLDKQPTLGNLRIEAGRCPSLGAGTVRRQRVWKAWFNFGHTPRRLRYSTQSPEELEFEYVGGLFVAKDLGREILKVEVIPPRLREGVHGITFCSSDIVHTEDEEDAQSFDGVYTREEYV